MEKCNRTLIYTAIIFQSGYIMLCIQLSGISGAIRFASFDFVDSKS